MNALVSTIDIRPQKFLLVMNYLLVMVGIVIATIIILYYMNGKWTGMWIWEFRYIWVIPEKRGVKPIYGPMAWSRRACTSQYYACKI